MSLRSVSPQNPKLERPHSHLTHGLLSVILLLCSVLFGVPVYSQSQPTATAPAITVTPGTQTFVVWGDIRFTDPAQCDTSDPDVRQTIVQAIAAVDPRPEYA